MHAETALYFMKNNNNNNNNKTIYKHLCRGVYSFRLSVRPCVCSYVRGIYHKFFTELRNSFSSGVYLTNQSSESIHIWTIGFLEGRLSFHDSWPQDPCPRVGSRSKSRTPLKSVFLLFCYESIHSWTIGTLKGRLSFHDSWPQGLCPMVGIEVQI